MPNARVLLLSALLSVAALAGSSPAEACVPYCGGRVCGDDGCGGVCGSCVGDRVCSPEGACVPIAGCAGLPAEGECQENPAQAALFVRCEGGVVRITDCQDCHQRCGSLGDGELGCVACESSCETDCLGVPDGCGGVCGAAPFGFECCEGRMQMAPQCSPPECRDATTLALCIEDWISIDCAEWGGICEFVPDAGGPCCVGCTESCESLGREWGRSAA